MPKATRADRAATDLLTAIQFDGLPVDLDDAVEYLGVAVQYERLDAVSGAILRKRDKARVVVNEAHPPRRQRFTLAHELGHYILHQGRQLVVDPDVRVNLRDDLSSLASDREEIEANSFAAALLMPLAEVRRQLAQMIDSGRVADRGWIVERLADRFQVSSQAMSYRLVNLGMLEIDSLSEA